MRGSAANERIDRESDDPHADSITHVPASVTERRAAATLAMASAVFAIVLIPFGRAAGPESLSFLSATTAAVLVAMAMTAALLFAQYRAGGRPPLAVLSLAYGATAALILCYGVTLPRAIGLDGALHAGPQSAPYLYAAWHVFFFALVLAYVAAERGMLVTSRRRVRIAAAAVLASVVAVVAATLLGSDRLPTLLTGLQLTALYHSVVVPVVLCANVIAGVVTILGTRLRMRSHLWLSVVLFLLFTETLMNAFESSGLFSYAWYGARIQMLVALAIMLVVLQSQYSAILRGLAEGNASLEKQNAQIAALIRLQHDMAAALPSRSQVVEIILAFAERETAATGAMLHIVEGAELAVEAGSGILAPYVGYRMKCSGSLAGLSIELMRVLHCKDTATDARVDASAAQAMGVRSLVDLPLVISDSTTVVLMVASTTPFAFSPADVQALQLAGTHLLSGLRAAEECKALQAAEVEQRRYAQQLRALHLIASATKGHRKEQLDAAIRLGLEELDLDWGYIAVRDAAAGDVVLENSVMRRGDYPAPQVGAHIRPETSLVERIASSRDVIVVERRDSPEDPVLEDPSWTSYIAVPLYIDGTLFGAMGFIGTGTRDRPFSAANVDFVRVAGDLVSSAVARGRQAERLDTLAFFDALTNLPNRVLLSDRLVQAILSARRHDDAFAVLFIDIDGFKAINDEYGHAAGDDVLRLVAARLESLMRESDTVARIGGDEFVVLAPKLRAVRDAWLLGNRILEALGQPLPVGGTHHTVGASIGVALYPLDGKDSQSLIERADKAMYVAKSTGKNRVQFASALALEAGLGAEPPFGEALAAR